MKLTQINPAQTKPAATLIAKRNAKSRIGELLLEMGKLNVEQINRILDFQSKAGLRFGDAAEKLGLVSRSDVQRALAIQFDYAYLNVGKVQFSKDLVAAYQPYSPEVEALRALRSQLAISWFNRGSKALTVISANLDEGCSSLCANLAVVFSQLGLRTLIVDANLREPDQHRIFALANSLGLSDLLIGRADEDVITTIEEFPGLFLMPAGTVPPNPQELLSRKSFHALIQRLQDQYDIILIDTPPASMSADAKTVAACCHGALLVSRLNETKVSDLLNVRDQLVVSEVEIVAAIVNG